MTVEEIRHAISVLARGSSGKITRVPSSLRAEVIALVRRDDLWGTARAVGLSPTTIRYWMGGGGRLHKSNLKGRFRRVVVRERQQTIFTLEVPCGIKIRACVSDIALLLRELGQ